MRSISQNPDQSDVIKVPWLVAIRNSDLLIRIAKRWQLYVFLILPVAFIITFHYVPMIGAQIAFRDFIPRDGIWGSEWVGLKNFQRFFDSYLFERLIVNTVTLGLYSLVASFPLPIILALSLNQVRQRFFKNTVQLLTYAPYFISTVVMVGLILQFSKPPFWCFRSNCLSNSRAIIQTFCRNQIYFSQFLFGVVCGNIRVLVPLYISLP